MFVGGSTVGLATLHNQDEVARKDVRVGDTVIVRKAGDVIPEVVGPVLAKRKKGARKWKFPTDCPVCDQPLVRLEGEADHRCVNVDCPAQRVQRIVFFAGRSAMDIEGLGEERVHQFVERRAARRTPPTSTRSPSSGWSRSSASASARRSSWSTPIDALEAAAAGQAARRARHPPRRSDRGACARPRARRASTPSPTRIGEELAVVDGVGGVIAESVGAFFANDATAALVEKLRAAGVNFTGPERVDGADRRPVARGADVRAHRHACRR